VHFFLGSKNCALHVLHVTEPGAQLHLTGHSSAFTQWARFAAIVSLYPALHFVHVVLGSKLLSLHVLHVVLGSKLLSLHVLQVEVPEGHVHFAGQTGLGLLSGGSEAGRFGVGTVDSHLGPSNPPLHLHVHPLALSPDATPL